MSPEQRVAGVLANFLQEKDEHAVISECLYPPLERFDAAGSGADPAFLAVWEKMDLGHVFGFPTWEKEAFALFSASFEELQSIFNQYAKSGTAGSASANAALTMQQTELQNLALDCGLSSETFSMTRVINIFKRADQVDDTFVESKADKRVLLGETAKGGDHGLELHEFFECLCMLAFQRANPKFGEVGHNDASAVANPMPGCLETMIKKNLLTNAKRDKLALVKASLVTDKEVTLLMPGLKARLKKAFDALSATGVRTLFGKAVISMDMFNQDLVDRGVTKDIMVKPTPAVVGVPLPEVHSNLSWLDCKGAFVTCQSGEGGQEGAETIDFDEFVVCLALCGHVKYEEVKEMSLAQRFAGIVDNYLQEKDEHAVITEAVVPPLEKFDVTSIQPCKGQSPADHQKFIATWQKMDVSHVFGFPSWEKEVFALLQGAFMELQSIFTHYARSGSRGPSARDRWKRCSRRSWWTLRWTATSLLKLSRWCGCRTFSSVPTRWTTRSWCRRRTSAW